MFVSRKAFARFLFIGFIAISLLVALFSVADYARGQALQQKWEAAAKQTAGRDPVQWWLSRNLNADKTHKRIFPGVDLTYIYDDSGLHANLALAPRTKLDTIQFQFEDLQFLSIDGNSEAFVQTAFGNFRLTAPTFSQELNGQDIPLSGGYQQSEKGTLGFWSGSYEANRALQIRFSMELVQQKAAIVTPNAPQAVNVTASKTDALAIDVDGDTKADPGDTLEYAVTIGNSGDTDATGVDFTDTIDANTTLVPGSVDTTPLAFADAYNAVGNVRIQVPVGSGLITNDTELDGTGGLTITPETKLSANNGNVTINADGSFTYNPFPGFEGADTFTYTLNDGEGNTDTGTATITVSGMIWFINNNATPPGDGRLTSPFSSIANFNSTAADATGENIFIFESANPYTGPPTLLNTQRLIGQDSTSTLSAITGITPPTFSDPFPATNSANGTIVNITSAANGVDLAQDNTLNGFTVGNSLIAVNGTLFGTLTVADVIINTNGQALSLNNGTPGGPGFISTTSSGGTNNVNLQSVGGTLDLGSGALSGATSHAFTANQGPGNINYSGTINNTTARSVSVTNKFSGTHNFSGAVSGTSQGVFINGNSGTATINFTGGLNLNTGANAAFTATGGGTVNATQNNTTIVNTLTTSTGTALNVANTTIGASGLTFRSISSNGGANGIILNNTGGGGLNVVGTGTSGSGGTIQNKTADGIRALTANNISLSSMNITGNGTSQTVPGSSTLCGGGLRTGNNLSCVANLFLQTVTGVTLTNVNVANSGQMGINGNDVTTFTMSNSTVTGNGNEQFENGLTFQNLNGTCSITNSMIMDNASHQINVTNIANNSNLTLNITGTRTNNVYPTVDSSTTEIGKTVQTNTFTDQSLLFDAGLATATNINMNLNLTGVVFKNSLPGNSVLINPGSASGTFSGTTTNCSFDNTAGGIIIQAQNGMGGSYNVTNSEFNKVNLQSILYGALNPFNATFTGTASGNHIGEDSNGTSGQACEPTAGSNCHGIDVNFIGGSGSLSTRIENNRIQQFGGTAILVTANGTLSPDVNVNIANNIILNPVGLIAHGIETNIGTTANANIDGCLGITGNNVTGTYEDPGVGTQFGIATRVRFLSHHKLPGYLGSPTDVGGPGSAVTDFIIANNTTGNKVFTQRGGSGDYPGGTPCSTPLVELQDEFISQPQNETLSIADADSSKANGAPTNTMVVLSPHDKSLSKTKLKRLKGNPSVVSAKLDLKQNQILPVMANSFGKEIDRKKSIQSSDSFEAPLSGETINLNIGTLPFGKSITVRFRATIDNPFPQGIGQVCNQATISGDNFSDVLSDDPDVGGATDPTCTTLSQADLVVTKTDSPDPVAVGNNITYTINFANNGPDGATNVDVTDSVPLNTTFVSAQVLTGTGWTLTAPNPGETGDVSFTKAAVANAETATFEIVVQTNSGLPDGTIISNTVDATSETPDGDTANNTDTETTLVQAPADIAVTKSDSPDPVIAGSNITYTIDFVNNGPNASSNVSVTDVVPANTTFVSAQVTSGTGWTITTPPVGGTGTIGFDKGLVATSETATFEIVVNVGAAVADGVIITNTVNATATTLDQDTNNNTDTETTTVQSRADLAVTKSDSPDPVVAGTNLTYTIDFVNNGPSNAVNVSVSDVLPVEPTFVLATAPAGWTSIIPPVGGTGTVTFTKPLVTPAETAQFTIIVNVNASVTAGTIITNSAVATSSTQDDSVGNNTGTATTTVIAQADLAITKSDSPDPVDAGANITYTLNFTNNGPSDAQSVSITDATPANTTFVSATAPAGWTSTTPPVGGTGTISFTRATSAAGESAQFTIVVNVNSDAADASTISNTADVTSSTTDPNTANNSDTETTTVQTSADLSITKTDSADPVAAGSNITYTLNFVNNGPSDAQNVEVSDTVPANTTFVSATAPAGWTSTTPPVGGTGDVLFEKATVTAGEAAQFTIVVAVAADIPDATVITNTATTTSDTTDPDATNNSDTETTTVNASSDLSVTKVDSVDPATAGQNLTYTITFVNNGPSDAQNVSITDPVPANTTFVSATAPAGWTSTTPPVGGTGTVSFTKATVLATETATFDIVVNIDASTPDNTILSNTVTATSDSADPDSSNNSATETTLVREPSDLSITKTDGVTDVMPGQSITYTIVASNVGRDDPAAIVTDDLPDELLNVTWTCVGAGGGICAPSGNGDINETVNLPDGGSVTFTVNATIDFDAVGQIVNTATITPGPGITDPDPSNNTATDTDTILCLFCDEFDDSMLDPNWTYTNSIADWAEDGNNLIGNASKKITAIASVFQGCTNCTIHTSMQTAGGSKNRLMLLAFYQDDKNTVELLMKLNAGAWILKQRVGGAVVAKQKVKLPILANVPNTVRLSFNGTQFQVFINGSSTPDITLTAVQAPNGTVGFKVRGTTGTFDYIRVF